MIVLVLFTFAAAAPHEEAGHAHYQQDAVAAIENPLAGMTFDVEGEPGVERTYFSADYRYIDYVDGDAVGGGHYELHEDGETCFHPDDEDAVNCWTTDMNADEDGWMTSTRVSDGLQIKVRPVLPETAPHTHAE